jgi:hypothetical protein
MSTQMGRAGRARPQPFRGARLCRALPLFVSAGLGACIQPSAGTASTIVDGMSVSRGAFVVRLGRDTVAVEQYSRMGNRYEADVVQRQPVTAIAHYVVTVNPDGTPQSLEFTTRRPDGSPVPNAPSWARVSYGPDTVATQIVRDTLFASKIAVKGAYPYAPTAFGMYELWLSSLLAKGIDSTTMPLLSLGARQPNMFPVKIVNSERARVYYGGAPQLLRIDPEGHLLTLDGTQTTNKVTVSRQPAVDVQAVAESFAAAEAAGRTFGATSPRDTARAKIGSTDVWVDYGRPATRGRDVWRNGVLGDTIWRTGANAATQFNTSADLQMAGVTIPAGKYTLWTHATSKGYELIFNRQVGQWGTVYNPAQDLVRVPLEVRDAPAPMERFTIALEPQGSGGILRLTWGTRQLSVPFTVK